MRLGGRTIGRGLPVRHVTHQYAWEALQLVENGVWPKALLYIGGSNLVGLLGVWLGATLARIVPV